MTNFQEDRIAIDTAVNSVMFNFFNLKDIDERADYHELADGLIEMIKRTKVHFIEVNEKYITKELTPEFWEASFRNIYHDPAFLNHPKIFEKSGMVFNMDNYSSEELQEYFEKEYKEILPTLGLSIAGMDDVITSIRKIFD